METQMMINRTALVFGATGGIGGEVALKVAQHDFAEPVKHRAASSNQTAQLLDDFVILAL
jgi:NAD(P)-dependent dehydrogenase (short-subunit alcohol dehydrogenase family)